MADEREPSGEGGSTPRGTFLSRGFVSALAGIAISLLAWRGPWAWPAWPTVVATELVFSPERDFSDLGLPGQTLAIVGLMTLNIATWALIVWTLATLLQVALRWSRERSQPRGQ